MPVRSRSSAASKGYATELIARSLSYGVAARSGLPGEIMPAPAHENQIGTQLADKVERLETIAGAGGLIAMLLRLLAKV